MNRKAKKSGYMMHNHLWLTQDLQAGDIINCRMLTKYDGAEEAEICPRTVMVLGFEMDPQTLEYSSIHVARFSHTPIYCRDDRTFLFHTFLSRKGLITGIDTPCVLQIDRTDFLPLNQDHFYGDVVDVTRIGRVDQSLFSEIRDSLKTGNENARNSHSRYPRRNPGQWYLPAMHLAGEEIENPHFEHGFTNLSEDELARVHIDWATRADTATLDMDYVHKCVKRLDDAIRRMHQKMQAEVRRKSKISVHSPFLSSSLSDLFAAQDDNEGNETASSVRLADLENEVPLLPEDSIFKVLPVNRKEELKALQELGREGLRDMFNTQRNVRLALPAHLWQGRYIMTRIPDLLDHGNRGQAFRPCVVWKVFKDRETGELAGLELHPATRSQADHFGYKFQVHPVRTPSYKPSFLIGDCIVRIPLAARYFHDNNNTSFYELPPDKLEKFAQKREHALQAGNVCVYGLKDVPENWVEAEMAPTPSFSQFVKWANRGEIRFDGNVNDDRRAKQRHHKAAMDRRKGKKNTPDSQPA